MSITKKVATKTKDMTLGLIRVFSTMLGPWWKTFMIESESKIVDLDRNQRKEYFKKTILDLLNNDIDDEAIVATEMSYLGSVNASTAEILTAFRSEMEKRLDGPHSYDQLKYLVEAKNFRIRDDVLVSVRNKNGYFDLTDIVPFTDRCNPCEGSGELYKFLWTKKTFECKKCKDPKTGKSLGYKFDVCPLCNGEKILLQDDETISCPKCLNPKTNESTGVIIKYCQICRKKGKYEKWYLHSIESTTRCHACQGNGWKIPRKKLLPAKPFHPAMTKEEAIKIKFPQEDGKTLGSEIKNATVVDP